METSSQAYDYIFKIILIGSFSFLSIPQKVLQTLEKHL